MIDMIERRIIAILTDFSLRDNYIGVMKGVILSINPRAIIVDLAHGVPKFNIRKGAFLLLSAYKYFPKNTIFLCVIDPGVGTGREGILLKTKNYYFIGPNNGLFTFVAQEDGIVQIIKLRNEKFFVKPASKTFHGRDIFAPVSAYLSLGFKPEELGRVMSLNELHRIEIMEPVIHHDYLEGEIIYVDDFGNCVTNIPGSALSSYKKDSVFWVLREDKRYVVRLSETYGSAEKGEGIILVGSHGFVEIAVNQGSAAQRYGLKEGARIRIELG